MIRSAWRIWKRFRWKNLVRVWAVFMAIALVLLAQTLGIHYGATKFTLKYMARNEAIPAQNAIMGQRATNLMLVDSSQDGVDEAEAMMKQVLLDMKVPTATVDLAKTDPDDIPSLNRYRTVLIVMPELDSLGDELVSIMRWVEGGGNMMLAMTPEKTGYLDAIGPQIGIESSAYDYVMTKGIKPARDFMLGGGHTYMFSGPFKSSLSLNLNEKATVEAVSANGHTPLIWSADVRSGRTVTCNIGIYGKVVRGFYASAFSLLGSATAYPVINSAAFYLDDFPSPVPSGDATYIKRDYGMSIADFYSKVWWPDLTKLAERYGIRFTGVMIENYGDDTKRRSRTAEGRIAFQLFRRTAAQTERRNRLPWLQPSAARTAEHRLWRRIRVPSVAESQSCRRLAARADRIPKVRAAGGHSVGICAAVQHPVQGRTADNRTRRARNPHHRQHLPAKRQQTALRAGIRCGR